jgi:hypothetical protein
MIPPPFARQIALKAALAHTPRLAGCVALSTWIEPFKAEVCSPFHGCREIHTSSVQAMAAGKARVPLACKTKVAWSAQHSMHGYGACRSLEIMSGCPSFTGMAHRIS